MRKFIWTSKGAPLPDNDKGISIKTILTVMAILVTILISTFPAVMAYGALNERVTNLENLEPAINGIKLKLNELDKSTNGNEIILQVIKEDIQEIKLDVKELLGRGS